MLSCSFPPTLGVSPSWNKNGAEQRLLIRWWINATAYPTLSLLANLQRSGWKLPGPFRTGLSCPFFPVPIQSLLLNYFLWLRTFWLSLIACPFPPLSILHLKRVVDDVYDYLYAVKAAGRSGSCTWASGIKSTLREMEPLAAVSMVSLCLVAEVEAQV